MDEAVIKYYRKLLKSGFEHSGSIENASIFLDNTGEKVLVCGSTGDFMQLYISVAGNKISNIKYLCVCDPTANVAVEILCLLMKGKTLDESGAITEQAFYEILGTDGEELQKKAKGLLQLVQRGIARYKAQNSLEVVGKQSQG